MSAAEDAAARKKRLKRLREEASAAESDKDAVEEPKIRFRNYAPRDEKIQAETVPPPVVKKFEAPKVEPETYDPDSNEDILINVAPKKPNADLRRDVEKKLAKLEKRTQRAMITIMQNAERERIAAEGGQQD